MSNHKLEAPEEDTYHSKRCHLRKTAERVLTPEPIEPALPLPDTRAPGTTPQKCVDPATAPKEMKIPSRPQRSQGNNLPILYICDI